MAFSAPRKAGEFPFVVRTVPGDGSFAGFDTETAALGASVVANIQAEALSITTRYVVVANPDAVPV